MLDLENQPVKQGMLEVKPNSASKPIFYSSGAPFPLLVIFLCLAVIRIIRILPRS